MNIRHIEIFAKTNNKKGDLFCRLMGDFFHALGYDEPRLDIHKSGREIDLAAKHRIESKFAIAECKAHEDTIGGSDINKFVGSFDAEQRKLKKAKPDCEAIGYFVSLSGFKETAIEQESDLEEQRLILISKEQIIKELIEGNIIVPIEKALSILKFENHHPDLINEVDLIAHSIGWVWVIYYGTNNTKTHFSFVHAEGKPLLESLATELIQYDSKSKKLLSNLTYLKPLNLINDKKEKQEEAKQKYFEYLKNECGNIHFEGMPTDKESGSVKVELEKIFQPLYLEQIESVKESKNEQLFENNEREPIGKILREKTRLAILAKPGGGKSTLLKRIAIAYSFHDRLGLVNDNLPDINWIPIFIRCRELGTFVNKSITEIIQNIPNRAEINFCMEGFSSLISHSLQNGSALLLIDGLDEISDDTERLLFVNQLRTFLATYPNIHIITTSREAGFRVIGGVLASYCTHYKISSLNPEEIKELTIKWHKAIIDNSDKTVKDAIELSNFILKDKRIQVLAENPLLLTTLLFVKRWAGYIPTKKSLLYEEMIKLLLVTWNVEGHEQLDIDEVEPQLAYVAYWMTENGNQTITLEDLKTCLLKSRREMPDILGYTKVSIGEFIKRVESRSSLLILAGHKKLENGKITPIYEFLHLSFQEYLTAKAVVEKYIPREWSNKSNLEIIKPHIEKDNWKEVIPLIAVLSKRGTNELIEFLIEESINILNEDKNEVRKRKVVLPPELLGSCIANEIQINPELLKVAIEWFAKNRYIVIRPDLIEIIANSKFSNLFFKTVRELYFAEYNDQHISAIGGLLGELNVMRLKETDEVIKDSIESNIISDDKIKKCIGLLSLMNIAFQYSNSKTENFAFNKNNFKNIEKELISLVQTDDKHILLAASWSIAWLGYKERFFYESKDTFITHLVNQWLKPYEYTLSRFIAWSIFSVLEMDIDLSKCISTDEKTLLLLQQKSRNLHNEYDKVLVYYIGSQIGVVFKKEDIETSYREVKNIFAGREKFKNMAKILGVELKAST